jgi:hypothetical protein
VYGGGGSPNEADEAIVTVDRAAVRRRAVAVREAATLPALLLLEVGAVVGLQRLGQVPALRIPWHDLGRELVPWLANSPVEYVLGAILRATALVMAWWLLASTTLYLLASLSRAPALIRGMARLTLPAVRRATDGAVAVALATSLLGASTTAAAATQTRGHIAAGPPPRAAGAVAGTALARVQAGPAAAAEAAQAGPTTTTREPGYQPSPADTAPPRETTTTQAQPGAPAYEPSPAGPSGTSEATTTTEAATTSTREATTTTEAATTTSQQPTTTRAPTTTSQQPTTTRAPSTTAGPPPTTATTTTAAPTTTAGSSTTQAPARSGTAAGAPGAPATTTPQPPGYVPSPAGTRPPSSPPPSSTQPPAPAPPPPATRPGLHRVVEGESLWSIARSSLALGTGRDEGELRNREVAAYWVRVLLANRGRLRSGNPDLIYPGEYVRLPAIKR